jgi:hypothetical protein
LGIFCTPAIVDFIPEAAMYFVCETEKVIPIKNEIKVPVKRIGWFAY